MSYCEQFRAVPNDSEQFAGNAEVLSPLRRRAEQYPDCIYQPIAEMYELCYPTAMRRIINGRRESVWEGESSSGAARLMQETPVSMRGKG